MARIPIIAGNWKMNGDISRTIELCAALAAKAPDWPLAQGRPIAVAVFPPFVSLGAAQQALAGSPIILGGQNMHEADFGAFTGEISAPMLLTAGCRMVILGHSERRQLFGETDAGINRKAKVALSAGLKPIVCVGEVLEDREDGRTEAVLEGQLRGSLEGLTEGDLEEMTIAYEPVWAIGTGRVATIEQAGEAHRFIRRWIGQKFSEAAAGRLRIQYGGSVKPDNAAGLLADPDIDGALVGGAALDADKFDAIIRAAVP